MSESPLLCCARKPDVMRLSEQIYIESPDLFPMFLCRQCIRMIIHNWKLALSIRSNPKWNHLRSIEHLIYCSLWCCHPVDLNNQTAWTMSFTLLKTEYLKLFLICKKHNLSYRCTVALTLFLRIESLLHLVIQNEHDRTSSSSIIPWTIFLKSLLTNRENELSFNPVVSLSRIFLFH